jgi:hypothetical protein
MICGTVAPVRGIGVTGAGAGAGDATSATAAAGAMGAFTGWAEGCVGAGVVVLENRPIRIPAGVGPLLRV